MSNLATNKLSIKLALRGLITQPRFFAAIVINIALGVSGFLVVGIFSESFQNEIQKRTRSISSGDLIVSARVKPTEGQIAELEKQLPPGFSVSKEISLVTMLSHNKASRLVEMRFVDEAFPHYGDFTLTEGLQILPGGMSLLARTNKAWLYPELQRDLGLKKGDTVQIGNLQATVDDFVVDDPTTSAGGFTFAPRAYVHIDNADRTGLLEVGSRVGWIWRYKFPPIVDVLQIEAQLKERYATSNLRIRSHVTSTDESSRLQTYLADYLGLVSLSALFLAMLGTSYLIRGHLARSVKDFAILMTLGTTYRQPAIIFLIQIVIFCILGTLLAAGTATAALPFLTKILTPIIGSIQIQPMSLAALGLAFVLCLTASISISLPSIHWISKLSPGILFRESMLESSKVAASKALLYLPTVGLWWLGAIWQAQSVRNGSVFAGSILFSALVLGLCGFLFLRLARKASKQMRLDWRIRLALVQIYRNPMPAMSSFLALALSTTLLNIIPQIRSSIAREIERPDSVIPQFFMFDIQEEQIEPLKDFLLTTDTTLLNPSPMIRARLDLINGTPLNERLVSLEGQRDQEQRESMQARMQNLSFRSILRPSESLIKGNFVTARWNEIDPPAISLEEKFAQRLGVGIGDMMSFDVSGVTIEGRITSIRKVRWTSFEPNFFILFQPGVLDDAPKIWLGAATLSKEPLTQDLRPEDSLKSTLQGKIVSQWPNISIVDVKAAVQKLLTLVDQISRAISFVAFLSLVTGLGVLFAVATMQAEERRLSFALLKSLGASHSDVSYSIIVEYVLLASLAVVIGSLVSIGVSYSLASYVFNSEWQAHLGQPIAIAATILTASLFLTFVATKRALGQSVRSLLS
jgi:putative ABC transport system permease protein